MFTDYYKILEVEPDASVEEIKRSYRRLAKTWHPDLCKKQNAEDMMKAIVEAYLILNDAEARIRYNVLYQQNKKYQSISEQYKNKEQSEETYTSYKSEDEILEKWILEAKRQAIIVTSQAYDDLKGTAKSTVEYFFKSSGIAITFFFTALLLLILIGIIKRAFQ